MHPEKESLTEVELAAYLEGRLSPEKRQQVERVLGSHKGTRDEVAAIRHIISTTGGMPEERVPAHLIEKAVRLYPTKRNLFDIAVSLVKDAVQVVYRSVDVAVNSLQPALGLRNTRMLGPRMVILKKSFADVDVELDIEKVEGSFCNIKVIVADSMTKRPAHNLRAELFSQGRELASELLEQGEVLFEDIGPGVYSVSINKMSRVFGEITLKIE